MKVLLQEEDDERWFHNEGGAEKQHDSVFRVPSKGLHVSAYGIYGDKDWRVPNDGMGTFQKLIRIVRKPHIQTIYVPVNFGTNAVVAKSHNAFKRELFSQGVTIYGQVSADGIVISRGEAAAFITSDNPVVTLWSDDSDQSVVCCVGLHSIVQLAHTRRGIYAVQHHNVIHNAIEALGVSANTVYAHIMCGIRTGFTHTMHHPHYGGGNLALQNFCEARYPYHPVVVREDFNMPRIVSAELQKCGVSSESIAFDEGDTEIDTFADRDLFGNPTWASSARFLQYGGEDARNILLVQYF